MPRLATLLTVGLLTAGAGGTFAIASHENGGSSGTKGGAATAQYCDEEGTENENGTDKGCKPGKGCGDKNHEHARDDQCKKNEHGDNNGGNGNGHGH